MNFGKLLLVVFCLLTNNLFSQTFSVNKIEPPFWWEGMKWDTLQLMIYGENLSGTNVFSESQELKITGTHNADSPNYLFVDIAASNLTAGKYELKIQKGDFQKTIKYKIKKRELTPESHKGFGREDAIYLIFVDRFADGDLANDSLKNEYEEFAKGDLNGRFGGDIQGIIDHLDYLANLGVTAIWHTPVLENNMYMSYHGYAATDLYKVDARFGSNKLYKKFVEEAHKRGLKVISDHVSNHIGKNHIWGTDTPFKDWFHGNIKNHPKANHNKIAFFDIHSDEETPHKIEKGWFTDYMLDLNKDNSFVANYMIQNTLWWIEFSGIDGIREDTYPYNELDYMSEWAKVVFENYPNFNIVGEVWKGSPAFLAQYQKDPKIKTNFNSNLLTITDFAFSESVRNYLSGSGGMWGIYETLAKDFLYRDPYMMMTFLDNHDVDRAMFVANNDIDKFNLAVTLLLTTRGIPQITYGTEIGMNGGGHHGKIRAPFPGGFEGDERDAFLKEERTDEENLIFNNVSKLLKLRNDYPALTLGKLIHFPPVDDVYVYFRIYKKEIIMIVINGSDEKRDIHLHDYLNQFGKINNLTDLIDSNKIDIDGTKVLEISSKSAKIFLVKR